MNWWATPATTRTPATEDDFCRALKDYGASTASLARIRSEPGFFDAVVRERGPWLARICDIRAAILANATDPKRSDQKQWMKDYAAMLDVDLFPEDDE